MHEKDIAINGWTGSGYVIIDPDTGAGAYKLDGGNNGGYAPSCAALVVTVVVVVVIAVIIAEILLPFIIAAMVEEGVAVGVANAIKIAVAAFLASFGTYAAAGNSSGGGGGGGVLCGRDDECNTQLKIDDDNCVAIAGPRYGSTGIRICQNAAFQRYAECLRFGVRGIRTPLTGVETPI